ncbi:MAG: HEAT repeat domain-containing protein, partial [Planctomycetes bacterium]|nr:HEAT repeat domain-containing protein [Planctomycetota bacterium]
MRAVATLGVSLLATFALAASPAGGQEIPDPAAQARIVESYAKLLEHEDARVRLRAVEMLAGLAPAARGVRAKIRVATSDPDAQVRAGAYQTLGSLGRKQEDLVRLAEGLGDSDLYVRGAAAGALAV